MGRLVKQFSETEEGDFRYMLADFADMLIEKEAERADLIVRMQVMCQDPLKTYSILCQKLKDEAKTRDSAVTKEANKQHQLNRVMMKEGANRPKLNQSQMELAGASHEVSQATETLAQSIQTFEEKKRDHLKSVLSEFLWSEIKYHGKMLEILTVHHQKLGETAFTDDVSRLVDKMKTHPAPPSLSPVRSLMR
ncbi:FAM92 protein [Chytriomyces cf. hyalinus JEL632]|nr:FAM92 protein [Chytriomyces cf. hyalinus JEL632]